MKISVRVKANCRQQRIEKLSANQFLLWVKAPPLEGKANQEVISLLSSYFGLPKNRISILKGQGGKNKIISVLNQVRE